MKAFFVVIISFSIVQCHAQSTVEGKLYLFSYFENNGEDGLHLACSKNGIQWQSLFADTAILKPVVGKEKLLRDPCIIKGPDGLFHMVWTVSWADKGIGYANSKDLVHWSAQQCIPVMQHEPAAKNCWAPEIIYDDQARQYMIYWATTIPGRFAATDSLGDDTYNHRIYFVTTKDFTSFSKAKILYNRGFNVIDATIQKAGHRFIMFLKDETLKPRPQKNILVAWSNHLTYGYSKPSNPITGAYWAEGPTAVHLGKKWMVYFDKYAEEKYGAVESTDLIHWQDISNTIQLPKGARHGSIFEVTAKEFAYLMALQ